MKNFLNVMLICFLTTGVIMACPPEGSDASGSKVEKVESGAMVEGTFVTLNLGVKGMTCGGCENKVKAALGSIEGVVETKKVSAESDEAVLTYDPAVTNEETIVKALTEKTGYAIAVSKDGAMTEEGAATKASCAKTCTKEQKAACTKEQKAACSKTKAGAEEKLEKQ
ncbi:MAG: heavy-metal-associated domain-containing protein [Bacteroidetes bacterium]|nr:heavy-metal-associated domain-containing protein [Bacteroidota bacterium]